MEFALVNLAAGFLAFLHGPVALFESLPSVSDENAIENETALILPSET
jgi:hypothetical protein